MNKYLRHTLLGLQFCALVLGATAFEVAREASEPARYIQSYREGFVKDPDSGLLGTLTMWRKRMVILVLRYREFPSQPRLPVAFSGGYNPSFFEQLSSAPAHTKFDQSVTICQAEGKPPLVEHVRVNGDARHFERDVERLDFGEPSEAQSGVHDRNTRVASYYSGDGGHRGFSLLESSRFSWRWLAPRNEAPGRPLDDGLTSCKTFKSSASATLESIAEAFADANPGWDLVRESGRTLSFTLQTGEFLAHRATARYSLSGPSDEMHRDYELIVAQFKHEGLEPWTEEQSKLTSDFVHGTAWRDSAIFQVGDSRVQVINTYNQGKPTLHLYYWKNWTVQPKSELTKAS